MPDVRRCAIYGCRSNSRENKILKFFNFPARDNLLYEFWLAICEESADSIRLQRRPYICSKHFHEKDVGFRRLATGAVPALYLKAPPGFADEEKMRLSEIAAVQAEKDRQINLVNDTVFEWSRRAQHYSETAPVCTTRRELRRVATQVRNLIGATLVFHIDDYWLRKFRRSHMCQMDILDLDESRNKTLDLATIIAELDPNTPILSEEEIAFLVKEEDAKMIHQIKLNKLAIDRAKKTRSPEAQLRRVCKKTFPKKLKKSFEEALNDYYGLSKAGNSKDTNLFNEESIEVKSEDNDFIDLSQDEEQCNDQTDMQVYDQKDEDSDISEPIPKHCVSIKTYNEALEHLKPLEDFALRQENYRAIGLLSTLEIIFKTAKK